MVAKAIGRLDFRSALISCQCRLVISDDQNDGGDLALAEDGPAGPIVLYEDRQYWYTLVVDGIDVAAEVVSDGRVFRQSPNYPALGVIDTKSQAGLLAVKVRISKGAREDVVEQLVEVLPVKFDLTTFRAMVDDICGNVLGLALRLNASARIPLRIRDRLDLSGSQQRFFFLRHLITQDEFGLALEQITKTPHSRVESKPSRRSLLATRRLGKDANRVIASGGNRQPVPAGHPLARLGSIPRTATVLQAVESRDTPENQFVKFALEEFVRQLKAIESACEASPISATRRVAEEAGRMHLELHGILGHSLFREVGVTSILPLGSPVLQRRPGYRELLEAWFKYHVAASLQWDGGEDVFGAGKRDTDKLYEYWLFFELLKLLSLQLGIPMPPADVLLSESEDGLFFRLKAGKSFLHTGIVHVGNVALKARFSYNRTFGERSDVASDGSWSLAMRPDFTISFWPAHLDEDIAERFFLAVHLHFDAKYRLRNASALFPSDETLDSVKEDEKKGNFKRGDVLTAHAYRDAIRRTGGAYILYPGSEEKPTLRQEYHEVLPGIGAFPVRPKAHGEPNGIERVGQLLEQVIVHLADQASARAKVAGATAQAYGSASSSGYVLLPAPQACFPLEWIRAAGYCPVQLSDESGEELLSANVLSAITAVLICESNGSALLFSVDRDRIKFATGAEFRTEYGNVPNGVFVLLPIRSDGETPVTPGEVAALDQLWRLPNHFGNSVGRKRSFIGVWHAAAG